ncbi:hypothetical protein [Microvirga pudoricolor]|uniref:hypothetical protein n=1 Tax=Microvirga pudoricolor TaxID=2778729 RepID=UPI00194DC415|nr:hypothetical protein [Microvirga pudoricolor]MBM6593045.1 hypothetical protein [Microvirga pudoricolor]
MKTLWAKPWLRLSATTQQHLHRGVDVTLGGLMLLGALAHVYGSFTAYPLGSEVLVWSLSAGGLALLLAALNLLRAMRPEDRTLAWICAGGCVLWALLAVLFGLSIGHVLDARVIFHAVVAAALADLSVRMALGKDEPSAAGPEAQPVPMPAPDPLPAPPRSVDVPPPLPVARLRVVNGSASAERV